jgi:CRP/FNR family cyclic AMP-dependent transcriptional regulator
MNQKVKHLSGAESILGRMDGRKSTLKYQRSQIVYSQGDPAAFVFYVQAGNLKVTIVSEEGKEAVVAILQAGSFCGEECLTGHKVRIATVTALTKCELKQLPKASIIRALHDDPEFSELFTTYLMERNIRVQDDLLDQRLNSTEKRLARLLLILAKHGQEDQPATIAPKISQETLAEMIGTGRTNVSFFMNKFRQLGLIEYNGGIKVNRPLLNRLLHGKPHIAKRD